MIYIIHFLLPRLLPTWKRNHRTDMSFKARKSINKPVFICFIDFTKAFDNLKQLYLWRTFETTIINKKYINFLTSIYGNSITSIKPDIGISGSISIPKGGKQGYVLSILLFCKVITAMSLNTEED